MSYKNLPTLYNDINLPFYWPIQQREDPLAVAAREAPLAVTKVAHHELDVRKTESRNSVLTSISTDHKDMACAWLTHRPNEREFDATTVGGVSGRGLFSSGEKCFLRTVVRTR